MNRLRHEQASSNFHGRPSTSLRTQNHATCYTHRIVEIPASATVCKPPKMHAKTPLLIKIRSSTISKLVSRIEKVSKKCPSAKFAAYPEMRFLEGADSRLRTDDLLITNSLQQTLENAVTTSSILWQAILPQTPHVSVTVALLASLRAQLGGRGADTDAPACAHYTKSPRAFA